MKTIQEALKASEAERVNLLKEINKERLSYKNTWYSYSFIYNNKKISFKAFGTWVQVLKVYSLDDNGISIPSSEQKRSSNMDIKVGEFKEFFLNLFESIDYGNYNN